ncbi:NAD(P)/FAD-dependent oxidoreductase [Tropicimonas sp. IMCC6043]|uniref:dihydrolipoyl dehydrogenase family protein n=1 Tax=Tropicimonas sp. IMCC6043 TaxID=2510645 RepID=UPI00101CBBCD|nr:FAD-dependent oxidoreductase [Tropicimonas sp. IMCC6043]RYH08978.1 dihydrolipoamide dehydrogenase [Tropicimonas sp. IMCC6043]
MERLRTDLCIIGAGSGGLSLAAGAAQMGAKVVLVEGDEMGGDCLNHGCVPSKALIAAAAAAEAQRRGAGLGVAPIEPDIDYAVAMAHVRRVINAIASHDSQERFEGLGVRVIRAWGRFVSGTELEAGAARISARRFVVATGSRPIVPPIDGLASVPIVTNETLFDLRERPDHLLVLGGGPVGLEMAQAHRRLGCRVTVMEAARALGAEDPEIAAVALEAMRAEGVEILEETRVERATGTKGAIRLETSAGPVRGTDLLVAAGRSANTERLNLTAAGVDFDSQGVSVDARLRSSNRRVYAIGDAAAGQPRFTHAAGYHATVLARSILFGLPARAATAHLPRVTYIDPEIAQVGMTEAEARRAHGASLEVIRVPFSRADRAIASGRTDGLVKIMVHRGRPVGAAVVGAAAGDLIAPWALMIANRLKMKAMANTVLPYPTLAEIGKHATGAYFSRMLFDSCLVRAWVTRVQRHIP